MNTTNLRFSSNRVRDISSLYHEELDSIYGIGEVGMFIRLLFEAFLGWSQTDLLIRRNETVNQSDLLRFHWALEDLKRHRPIQHIIGYADFCGCRINVDENTLIPRPETEEIVNHIINSLVRKQPCLRQTQNSKFKILDLCTGSGCIAIALAKHFPDAEVWAVDISEKALEVARRNAQANNVKVNFIQADVLSQFTIHNSQFSIIISNPPYVMERERAEMQPNVLDWEPSAALFVPDNDPLRFYRAIAKIAQRHLAADGMLVVEINEKLASETSEIYKEIGLHAEIKTDFRGKSRAIIATK